jgi:hypothetical protein
MKQISVSSSTTEILSHSLATLSLAEKEKEKQKIHIDGKLLDVGTLTCAQVREWIKSIAPKACIWAITNGVDGSMLLYDVDYEDLQGIVDENDRKVLHTALSKFNKRLQQNKH